MANPEIDIKMNIVPPNIDDIKKRIAEITEEAKAKEKELGKFGTQAVEMSEAVSLMLERAKATGKANLEELMTSEFASVGLDEAVKLSETVNKYFAAFDALPVRLTKVFEAVQSGSMSIEDGMKRVEQFGMLLNQLDVSALESNTSLLDFDLSNASALDEVLAAWERLSKQADQNAEEAKALEQAARAKASALLAEKEALDTTSAGYEKQANELLKSSMAYDVVGDSAAKQVAKFESFKAKLTEALSGADSAEGVKKVLALFKEQEASLSQYAEKTKKINKELEATDNARVERLRKASEAAQKAEEQAQKRAEAEEKRVQKNEELAQREKFAMELVGQSRQQLIETIKTLTEEQKKASEAEDKEAFRKYTLQLAAARQQLERLRNSTNLSRIAFSQQSQTAGQLANNVKSLVSGFANFGDSVENGTVDLAGMSSALMQMKLAINGVLGPIGWAVTAVELLSTAWNWYAKEQKKAEEAEKKRQEQASKLVVAYHEAAEAAKEFHEEEERKFVLEKTQEWYANLNKELEIARDYTNEIYRNEQARLTLLSKEDELEFTLERNKIQRDYIAGKISEEQRDEKLDELNIKKTQRKALRTQEDNESDIKKAYEDVNKIDMALKNAEEMLKVEQQGRRYKVSLADANMYYTQAEGMKNRYEARAFLEEKLGKIAPEEFEQYALLHKAEEERVRVAEEAVRDLRRQAEAAARQYETAKNNAETAAALSEQAIKHAKALADDNKATRVVVQEAKMRKDAEKQAAVARNEAQRRAKLQSEAIVEGEYEDNLTKQARAIARGGGYKMLADNRLSSAEIKSLIDAAQKNTENEAFMALVRDILQTAISNKNVTARELGKFRKQLEKANINNID